jgi:glycosyltransferase involved in cell wall biosynthesis
MVDIVAVTYGQNEILKCFINSIKSQTNNNWRLIIIHDGPNPTLHNELKNEGYLNSEKIEFIEHPTRSEHYGHFLRKWSLENVIKNEYVLLTNGDNYYTPNMIEEVSKRNEDLIYFDLVHSHKTPHNNNKSTYGYMNSELVSSKVDMGNVIIKSELAKKVGFNSIVFNADWIYFNEVLQLSPTTFKIDKVLFVHN